MAKKRKRGERGQTAAEVQPAGDGFEALPERSSRGEDVVPGEVGGIRVHRLRGGLRELYESGEIDQAAYDAAQRWRGDFEFGVCGATDPERRGGGPDSCYQSARLAALGRWRRASEVIGPQGVAVLHLFAVECVSLSAASRIVRAARDGRSWAWAERVSARADAAPRYAELPAAVRFLRRRLVEALDALGSHYAAEERARRLMQRSRAEARAMLAA